MTKKIEALTHSNIKNYVLLSYMKSDIKVTKVSYNKFSGLTSSKLVLSFKNANTSLINTIRRVCLAYIPTYAFCSEGIKISENTSIYDNDYMRLRLSQLVIPDLKIPINYLNEQFWHEVNYNDMDRPKHPDDTQNIEMYLNVTNDTADKLDVTTNHAEFYIDGERIQPFNKEYPSLLIQLRPNDKFNVHMKAMLGLGRTNDIWGAARNSYYNVEEDNSITFTVESIGQLTEFDILDKACMIIKRKVYDLKTILSDKYKDLELEDNILTIVLDNEDHTIGGILNEYLQENKDVIFSGMCKPDLLIQQVIIKLQCKKDPLKVVNETIDTITDLMDDLKEMFKKLK